jgi:sulfoxide reductase heme-binding subunit YedZ
VNARTQPLVYLWWLVSRASGVVALMLISLSVLMGLAMASKALHRPGLKRTVVKLHEHVALTALLAIGVHGLSLLGDHWLKPGWGGITVPFAMGYRPQYTGLGIIGGYLAVLLGPSFYFRRRIGARTWRQLHRLTTLVWLLTVVHTIGAGSDARKPWLDAAVVAPGLPIVYLTVLRGLNPQRSAAHRVARSPRVRTSPARTHDATVSQPAETSRPHTPRQRASNREFDSAQDVVSAHVPRELRRTPREYVCSAFGEPTLDRTGKAPRVASGLNPDATHSATSSSASLGPRSGG